MTDKMPDVIYVLTDDDGDYLAFSEHDALAKKYIHQDSINVPDFLDDALKARDEYDDMDTFYNHMDAVVAAAKELQRIKGLK